MLTGCLEAASTGRCRWGISVKAAGSSQQLYDRNAQLMFNPASNVKLITSAAALHRLGPGFRFRTWVHGRVERGRVKGGLYLRGSGDPTLTTAELAEMAEMLWGLGIREVDGPVYLDDSLFDVPTDPPGYRKFRSSHPFRAGVGALSLNHNVVQITVTPGQRPGERAQVALEPQSDYLKLLGAVWTTARAGRLRVATHSKVRWTGVSATGRIHLRSGPRRYWRRVFQPALYTGHTLLAKLAARGMRVRHPRLRLEKVPPTVPVLVTHRSPRLETIIYNGNKHSANLVAEHLLLVLGSEVFGAPATYAKGREAVARYLEGHGIKPGSYFLENGSGLSRRSRIRPADLVRVLEGIHRDAETSAVILSSLPVAGLDGTLRRRFQGAEAKGLVRAKTGTLSGILALSGYAGYRDRRLFFSFLAARVQRGRGVRRRQEAMSGCLVRFLREVAYP